ncbi:VOC family protein [Kocuria turfanensis]|uniref:VOC family protein n=1 Tax=Kocuria turfanensis TaxID=388357 RepID=UPI004035FA06
MAYQFYPHIPVADLARSWAFYEALGWSVARGLDEGHSVMLELGENFGVTLVERAYMQRVIGGDQELADPGRTVSGGYALVVDTPEEVDALAERAVAAGATTHRAEDAGYMRNRVFADPDGHRWNIAWVDPLVMERNWDAVKEKYPEAALPQG